MRQKFFLTIFFLPIIILGCSLAWWQYQRSLWKQDILSEYQHKIYQDPLPLPTIVIRTKGDQKTAYGYNQSLFEAHRLLPITVLGHFRTDLVFYRPSGGGIELITAFETKDGVIAVNVGKMPYAAKNIPLEEIIPVDKQQGTMKITGFYRIAKPYGANLPKPRSLVSAIPFEVFYNKYQAQTLAGALQIDDKTKISDYVKGRSAQFFMGNIPNNHVQYMYTWLFLSIIAAVIYILLWRKIG